MPSPLDAWKYIIGNPGEAAGMAKDMMMQNYYPMPEQDFGQAGQMPFPNPFFPDATMQGTYDTARDLTAFHPAMELGTAAVTGGPIGRRIGRVLGKLGGAAFRGAGDEMAQYMGRMKGPGGGGAAALSDDMMRRAQPPIPQQASPLGGYADDAAGMIRGDLPPQPGFADDFAAMDQMGGIDPSMAPQNPYQQMAAEGPMPSQGIGRPGKIGMGPADADTLAGMYGDTAQDIMDLYDRVPDGDIGGIRAGMLDEAMGYGGASEEMMSMGVDETLINQLGEYMQMGLSEEEALEALMLQYSDYGTPYGF